MEGVNVTVIIDTPLLSNLIIGLPTIREFKIFRLLPGLVENTEDDREVDWNSIPERNDYPIQHISEFKPDPNVIMEWDGETDSEEDEESAPSLHNLARIKSLYLESYLEGKVFSASYPLGGGVRGGLPSQNSPV